MNLTRTGCTQAVTETTVSMGVGEGGLGGEGLGREWGEAEGGEVDDVVPAPVSHR